MLLEKREVRKNTACRFFLLYLENFRFVVFKKKTKNLAENKNETLP